MKGKTYNKLFQLTTSQGGRLAGKSCIVGMLAFQLTTSQGGRQATAWAHDKLGLISTHDLTKRSNALRIFRLQIQVHFNSRPHEEVDSQSSALPLHPNISTHDLTKRSTATDVMDSYSVSIFQLTTSRRGRLESHTNKEERRIFQLTTSRRGRPDTAASMEYF